jgi:serine/threonine protein kinase
MHVVERCHARREVEHEYQIQEQKYRRHRALWKSLSEEEEGEKNGTAANLNEYDDDPREIFAKEISDSVLATTPRPSIAFHDAYEKGALIYQGPTAKVYECIHKQTRQVFAVKEIERKEGKTEKAVIEKTLAEAVLHEVGVLDSLKHSNIMHVNALFEDEEHFFLVMECMRGGNVYDRIMESKRYTEDEARTLAKKLLGAVRYIHERGFAHRDLKPQNLLLNSDKDRTDIKISDFGFACRVRSPQSLTKRCGTPSYVTPEVLKNIPYDQSADMWSVGVTLYFLLCGHQPFADENQGEME